MAWEIKGDSSSATAGSNGTSVVPIVSVGRIGSGRPDGMVVKIVGAGSVAEDRGAGTDMTIGGAAMPGQIYVEGRLLMTSAQPIHILGANTPYNVYDEFGSADGYDSVWWNAEFLRLKEAGFTATRILFVCSSKNTGVTIDPDTLLCTVTSKFWADADSLMALASTHGIYVTAVLTTFECFNAANEFSDRWLNMLGSEDGVRSLISELIVPFAERYKANVRLWAIDLGDCLDFMYQSESGFPVSSAPYNGYCTTEANSTFVNFDFRVSDYVVGQTLSVAGQNLGLVVARISDSRVQTTAPFIGPSASYLAGTFTFTQSKDTIRRYLAFASAAVHRSEGKCLVTTTNAYWKTVAPIFFDPDADWTDAILQSFEGDNLAKLDFNCPQWSAWTEGWYPLLKTVIAHGFEEKPVLAMIPAEGSLCNIFGVYKWKKRTWYNAGDVVYTPSGRYVCTGGLDGNVVNSVGGRSGFDLPPSGDGSAETDSDGGPLGSATWALLTNGDKGWEAGKTYSSYDLIVADGANTSGVGRIYQCFQDGVAASSGSGPTGTGQGIIDGTATWNYRGPFKQTANEVWEAMKTAGYVGHFSMNSNLNESSYSDVVKYGGQLYEQNDQDGYPEVWQASHEYPTQVERTTTGGVGYFKGMTCINPTGAKVFAPDISNPAYEAADIKFDIQTAPVRSKVPVIKTISPFIYGKSAVALDENGAPLYGVTFGRIGGNRMTAYNWETGDSNAGADWHNQNDYNYWEQWPLADSRPAGLVCKRIQQMYDAGCSCMVAIPTCGYVAADHLANGDVGFVNGGSTPDPTYLSTRYVKLYSTKPTAFSMTPDTTDSAVYSDEMAWYLAQTFPKASEAKQIIYNLDNEADLWPGTHPRIHPLPTTYAELIANHTEYALAIKTAAPDNLISGWASYGWNGWLNLQGAPDAPALSTVFDSGIWFLNEYCLAMKNASVAAGKRLFDCVTLHFYSAATNGVWGAWDSGSWSQMHPRPGYDRAIETLYNDISAEEPVEDETIFDARLQTPRSLWDENYIEVSWIAEYATAKGGNTTTLAPLKMIPWMLEKIEASYPGTKLGITEYNFGGGNNISGTITQCDVLGIFGVQGLYLANLWPMSFYSIPYINTAFIMYREFDQTDKTRKFGDSSILASTDDIESSYVYASIHGSDPSEMILNFANKSRYPKTVAIAIASNVLYDSTETFVMVEQGFFANETNPPLPIPGPSFTKIGDNCYTYEMPALSVTTAVLTGPPVPVDEGEAGDRVYRVINEPIWPVDRTYESAASEGPRGTDSSIADGTDGLLWKYVKTIVDPPWHDMGTSAQTFVANNVSLVNPSPRATNNSGSVIKQSAERTLYIPGADIQINATFKFSNGSVPGVTQMVGWFDEMDGIFFKRLGGTTVVDSIVVRAKGIDTEIPRANWSIDPMDGAGGSGLILDPTKIITLAINVGLLHGGKTSVGFVIDGGLYWVHDLATEPYPVNPDLPLRWEITSTEQIADGEADLMTVFSGSASRVPVEPKITKRSWDRDNQAKEIASAAIMSCGAVKLSVAGSKFASLRLTKVSAYDTTEAIYSHRIRWFVILNPTVLTGSEGTWYPFGEVAEVAYSREMVEGTGTVLASGYFEPASMGGVMVIDLENMPWLTADVDGISDIVTFQVENMDSQSRWYWTTIEWEEKT